MSSTASEHNEWLSLIGVSGHFLSVPLLLKAFPQGLEPHDPATPMLLRQAFEEWQKNQGGSRPGPAMHHTWVVYVFRTALGFDSALVEGPALPPGLNATFAEHGETLQPDLALFRGRPGERTRLLIKIEAKDQNLEGPLRGARWKASPATRMAELLRGIDVPLGLLTNGEQWQLAFAPRGETAGFASWLADLLFEEPITLRAFRSLLSLQRFYGVPDEETPEGLLKASSERQQEVTVQLGRQVHHAIAVLITTLERNDRDRGRRLLAGIAPEQIYEAALTVMMRLVFLFSAEERGLLRLGDHIRRQLRRFHAGRPVAGSGRAGGRGSTRAAQRRLESLARNLPDGVWRAAPRCAAVASLWRRSLRPRPHSLPGRPRRRRVLA